MTAIADKLRATAQRLVSKFGILVEYRLDDADYSAAEQDVTGDPTLKLVKISPPEDWVSAYGSDSATVDETTDLKTTLPLDCEMIAGVLSRLTFTPVKGHSITWDDVAHEVLEVKTIAGDENPVAYELRLKRGGD